MSENDVIILNSILQKTMEKDRPGSAEGEFLNLFCFEQILKDYELSPDEVESGYVDTGDDGGVDGVYFFVNTVLVDEDTELTDIPRDPRLHLVLIQVKSTATFAETAVEKLITTTSRVLDLGTDVERFRKLYNARFLEKVRIFKQKYLELASLHPQLRVSFYYATKGDTGDIHPKVRQLSEELQRTVYNFFRSAEAEVVLLGARELIEAYNTQRTYTLKLQIQENPISRGPDNYVVLVSLTDYYRFVTDDQGDLRRYIFESNVRDYQGANIEVNRDIRASLQRDDAMDFWWLNNGITVLASKVTIAGKLFTLDNIQIVNGLQTTQTIFEYLKGEGVTRDKDNRRSLLLRIIVTNDPAARDRIIKATNFQNPIPASSLKATDEIQRNIEHYFLSKGWYYDRRKNYYRNLGMPLKRIVGIPYLAQSVMAIVLREPDNARARPSSLIKRDEDYVRVFSAATNPEVYIFCAMLMRRMDEVVRTEVEGQTPQERGNLKYHAAMMAVIQALKSTTYEPNDLRALAVDRFSDAVLKEALISTIGIARDFSTERVWTIERLAKNREFVEHLLLRALNR
jgi:hypothetical protein